MSLVPRSDAHGSAPAETAAKALYCACHLPEPVVLFAGNAVEFARMIVTLSRIGSGYRWAQLGVAVFAIFVTTAVSGLQEKVALGIGPASLCLTLMVWPGVTMVDASGRQGVRTLLLLAKVAITLLFSMTAGILLATSPTISARVKHCSSA